MNGSNSVADKKLRIGLLTFYSADYGSFYQGAALHDQLTKMGHSVEFVDESFRYANTPRLLIGGLADLFAPKALQELVAGKYYPYSRYLVVKQEARMLGVASPKTKRNRYSGYDLVVVGSDELWSVSNKYVHFIEDCFGIGITCPHISYGTSGITVKEDQVSPKMKKKMTEGLRSFTRLSVRDQTTKEWVERWLGKPGCCAHVIDPNDLSESPSPCVTRLPGPPDFGLPIRRSVKYQNELNAIRFIPND